MKIKNLIRYIASYLIGFSLIILGFVKREREKAFKKKLITSIYFHNPDIALFERCIKWLMNKKYHFISIDELYEILTNMKQVNEGAVCLSADDGWMANIDNIAPILKKYNVPMTFFISTNPVEKGYFWTALNFYYNELRQFGLANKRDLKKIPEIKRKEIINTLEKNKKLKREALTIDDVKDISKIPEVTIGSHTVHHAITKNCSDIELDYEISESKKKLESWTGEKIKYFSYPNGDYNEREKPVLEKYKYKMAFTTEARFINTQEEIDFFKEFHPGRLSFFINFHGFPFRWIRFVDMENILIPVQLLIKQIAAIWCPENPGGIFQVRVLFHPGRRS